MTTFEAGGVCVVVAAFNEARAVGGVVSALRERGYETVVVDDGSRDDTAAVAAAAGAHVLVHPVNRGQGAALQTGILYALRRGAEIIVTFDSDGQHDPEDISRVVAPIRAGRCDVVLGSRFLVSGSNPPPLRRAVLKLGVLFTRAVSRIRLTDVHNGLRAFTRPAAASLEITMDRMAHASEIIDQVGRKDWRFEEVPVTIRYDAYSLGKGQRSSNAVRIALQVLAGKLR